MISESDCRIESLTQTRDGPSILDTINIFVWYHLMEISRLYGHFFWITSFRFIIECNAMWKKSDAKTLKIKIETKKIKRFIYRQ